MLDQLASIHSSLSVKVTGSGAGSKRGVKAESDSPVSLSAPELHGEPPSLSSSAALSQAPPASAPKGFAYAPSQHLTHFAYPPSGPSTATAYFDDAAAVMAGQPPRKKRSMNTLKQEGTSLDFSSGSGSGSASSSSATARPYASIVTAAAAAGASYAPRVRTRSSYSNTSQGSGSRTKRRMPPPMGVKPPALAGLSYYPYPPPSLHPSSAGHGHEHGHGHAYAMAFTHSSSSEGSVDSLSEETAGDGRESSPVVGALPVMGMFDEGAPRRLSSSSSVSFDQFRAQHGFRPYPQPSSSPVGAAPYASPYPRSPYSRYSTHEYTMYPPPPAPLHHEQREQQPLGFLARDSPITHEHYLPVHHQHQLHVSFTDEPLHSPGSGLPSIEALLSAASVNARADAEPDAQAGGGGETYSASFPPARSVHLTSPKAAGYICPKPEWSPPASAATLSEHLRPSALLYRLPGMGHVPGDMATVAVTDPALLESQLHTSRAQSLPDLHAAEDRQRRGRELSTDSSHASSSYTTGTGTDSGLESGSGGQAVSVSTAPTSGGEEHDNDDGDRDDDGGERGTKTPTGNPTANRAVRPRSRSRSQSARSLPNLRLEYPCSSLSALSPSTVVAAAVPRLAVRTAVDFHAHRGEAVPSSASAEELEHGQAETGAYGAWHPQNMHLRTRTTSSTGTVKARGEKVWPASTASTHTGTGAHGNLSPPFSAHRRTISAERSTSQVPRSAHATGVDAEPHSDTDADADADAEGEADANADADVDDERVEQTAGLMSLSRLCADEEDRAAQRGQAIAQGLGPVHMHMQLDELQSASYIHPHLRPAPARSELGAWPVNTPSAPASAAAASKKRGRKDTATAPYASVAVKLEASDSLQDDYRFSA